MSIFYTLIMIEFSVIFLLYRYFIFTLCERIHPSIKIHGILLRFIKKLGKRKIVLSIKLKMLLLKFSSKVMAGLKIRNVKAGSFLCYPLLLNKMYFPQNGVEKLAIDVLCYFEFSTRDFEYTKMLA